jgi:hypothetical protein
MTWISLRYGEEIAEGTKSEKAIELLSHPPTPEDRFQIDHCLSRSQSSLKFTQKKSSRLMKLCSSRLNLFH